MMEEIKKYFLESRPYYIFCLAIMVINLVFFYAVVSPGKEKAKSLKEESVSLRQEKTKVRENLRKQLAYSARAEAMEADIRTFLDKLPAEKEMTQIISKIHSLAKKAGLSIKSAKYTPSLGKKGELIHYSIVAPVSGPYKQVRKFIYDIEGLPYLLSIDDLGLTSNRESTVSLSLKISVYFRGDSG